MTQIGYLLAAIVLVELAFQRYRLNSLEGRMVAELEALRAQVEATVGVEASAVALIQGTAARIDAAVAAAIAAGATPEVLQGITDESAKLKASADALAAAVTAGTPPPVV